MDKLLYSLLTLNICWQVLLFSSCGQSQTASSSKAIDWTKDSTAHFVLYAQKGVRSENSLPAIGQQLEHAQSELLHLLNESAPQRLAVYFLKDRETLTAYTGFPANGYTDTERGIIYFVDKAPFHLAFRHEIMHALSWRLWGPAQAYWLSEGIAVFASGNCGGYPFHALAQAIQQEGKLASFQYLSDTFDFKAVEPSLQSASMVQYIFDNYGVAGVKELWKTGWQNAQQTIGISPDELQKRWLNAIGQPTNHVSIDWSNIHTSGCE